MLNKTLAMFTIQDFFGTLQKDLIYTVDYISGKKPKDQANNQKISFAAVKIIASLGLAFSALKGLVALTFIANAPTAAVLTLALSVAGYLLFRDIFLLAKNEENHRDLNKITKKFFDFDSSITNDTFYKPIWDRLLIKA